LKKSGFAGARRRRGLIGGEIPVVLLRECSEVLRVATTDRRYWLNKGFASRLDALDSFFNNGIGKFSRKVSR
jgi:hypothetical protein